MVELQEKVNNLLITDFKEYCNIDGQSVVVVYITERYGYTPISAGYRQTIVINNNRSVLRSAVIRALDYAYNIGIPVQCDNSEILQEIAEGIIDGSKVEFIDFTEV